MVQYRSIEIDVWRMAYANIQTQEKTLKRLGILSVQVQTWAAPFGTIFREKKGSSIVENNEISITNTLRKRKDGCEKTCQERNAQRLEYIGLKNLLLLQLLKMKN